MPNWLKILLAIIPKKAIAEAILCFLKDFAKTTKTNWDDEFIENVDKWLRENNLLDMRQRKELQENLKKEKTLQSKESQ